MNFYIKFIQKIIIGIDIKHKREKAKIIIFKKYKKRFIRDLTEISNELKINSKYVYLFI